MGSLLHKLWDETLAGPTPDSGLGKLRKYSSFPTRSAATPPHDENTLLPISRKIALLKSSTDRNLSVSADSPSYPSGSSATTSPVSHKSLSFRPMFYCMFFVVVFESILLFWAYFSNFGFFWGFLATTPGGNFNKLTRRKSASAAAPSSESKSPTGYDWIVLSALDR